MVKKLDGREAVWWATVGGKRVHDDAHVDNADGETQATGFLKTRVANIMGENPKLASALAKWFETGCKVEHEELTVNYVRVEEIDPAAVAPVAKASGK
jgi:hypothetical protein